jgi:hypothetical protein
MIAGTAGRDVIERFSLIYKRIQHLLGWWFLLSAGCQEVWRGSGGSTCRLGGCCWYQI